VSPSSNAQRKLDAAWDALGRGRLRSAVKLGWEAAVAASSGNDATALRQVIALGDSIRAQASGGERDRAAQLVRYCRESIDHPRQSLATVFGIRLGEAVVETKVCPDCAETVRAAARVCRFCGHSFEVASGG
jgi:hypothetical protein